VLIQSSRGRFLFLIVPMCLASSLIAAAPQRSTPPAPDITLQSPGDRFTFVSYGDIRFMDVSDTRHSNPVARVALVEKIAKEKPVFITISGDLVYRGADALEWLQYDRETKIWRDQKIAILPALGDHDVQGGEAAALANYFQRFPLINSKRWYSARCGSVLVLTLDSMADDRPGSAQWKWLEANLATVPADVDFVIISLHHPLYTRSTVHLLGGGHSLRNREKSMAEMIEKHQTEMRARIVVVSGHVHNYERYEHGGVMYVVTGGGGATPYFVKRQPDDFYREEGVTYHYVRFQIDRGRLKAEMIKYLDPKNWAVKDTFELSVSAK
jgi:hypothetical protein